MLVDHIPDAIAHLSADADPVVEPGVVDGGFLDGTARVVRADLLDKPPVAGVFLVGDDDVIVGTLLRAGACQSNLDNEFLVSGGPRSARKEAGS